MIRYLKSKRLTAIVLTIAFYSGTLTGQQTPDHHGIFKPGEYLKYKVSFLFLNIGTIEIYNTGLTTRRGITGYKIKLWVRSEVGFGIVDIDDYYETILATNFSPLYFYAHQKFSDPNISREIVKEFYYHSNHELKSIVSFTYDINRNNLTVTNMNYSTVYTNEPVYETLPLLFYARYLTMESQKNTEFLVSVGTNLNKCIFYETHVPDKLRFERDSIPVIYMNGKVTFLGIAGIKDGFQGWFTSDSRRVPLKAKLKAFFGNIVLNLEEDRKIDREDAFQRF